MLIFGDNNPCCSKRALLQAHPLGFWGTKTPACLPTPLGPSVSPFRQSGILFLPFLSCGPACVRSFRDPSVPLTCEFVPRVLHVRCSFIEYLTAPPPSFTRIEFLLSYLSSHLLSVLELTVRIVLFSFLSFYPLIQFIPSSFVVVKTVGQKSRCVVESWLHSLPSFAEDA